jgi:hypothetical protein
MADPSTLIIDDDNAYQFILPVSQTGYEARDYERTPYGSVGAAPPADIELIPYEQWPDIIADLERTKSTLKDIWADSKIGVLNQKDYPFCHGFAAIMAVLIQAEKQGLPYVELSASSVAAPVTNYTKAGAWIGRDLKQIVNVGVAPVSLIPMLTHRKSDFPQGWENEAAKHKVTEFAELRPRDFQQQGSAILQGHGVSVGQSHWSHAVVQVCVRDMDKSKKSTDPNRYGLELINSWSETWGDRGFAIQVGSKKYADEAYIVRQVII